MAMLSLVIFNFENTFKERQSAAAANPAHTV
jgi:hypothetical protein